MQAPFSHADHAAHVAAVALSTHEVRPVFVQFRRRGETFCGRILEAVHLHGREWYRCRSAIDDAVFVQASNVRVCSGDGRCHCEAVS